MEAEKHLLSAWVGLWRGAPGEALASAEALLAKQPENYPALTAKGDALRQLGKDAEAGACYRQALDLFHKQNPKSYEPPILLMDKLNALSGSAPPGAPPAPGTGPAPGPAAPPQAPPGAAPAAPEVRFKLPAGWQQTDQAGEIVLVPANDPQGQTASLTIGKARGLKTDLGAYSAQQWADQTRDGEVSDDTGGQNATGEAGEPTVLRAAWLKARDGKRTFVLLLIARTGDHVFHFTYRTPSLEMLKRDQQVLDRFFRDVSFGGPPPDG